MAILKNVLLSLLSSDWAMTIIKYGYLEECIIVSIEFRLGDDFSFFKMFEKL